MADHYYARIKIGGTLRADDVSRFCAALGIHPGDVNGRISNGCFVFENDEASYGRFEELEDLCRELELTFVRESDGKYGFSAEVVFWAPGMDEAGQALADHDNNLQVDMEDVRAIREALRADDIPEARHLCERVVVDLPEFPLFRIGREVT
ncbi:MAG: hypothetical protein HN742_26870 [Lentisphaerae bacterium]|jgi:hypothetical protein|nr:hypothetical protein [Lentisphaerota bacterium]MBT4818754.1 hypothetical protein [Lentisphaerota bacterium]MBT5606072.1 hypothetical protein [Lentisphaerota bacterium]MBT7057053.1 hypothetical protein [Lentisphaerota bacterium]MBT7845525.1 hypothetical protein [Lentisphaerota bacterium]